MGSGLLVYKHSLLCQWGAAFVLLPSWIPPNPKWHCHWAGLSRLGSATSYPLSNTKQMRKGEQDTDGLWATFKVSLATTTTTRVLWTLSDWQRTRGKKWVFGTAECALEALVSVAVNELCRERGEEGSEAERGWIRKPPSSGSERSPKVTARGNACAVAQLARLLPQVSARIVCLLVAYRPSNRLVYLRDGSAQTIWRAATLR